MSLKHRDVWEEVLNDDSAWVWWVIDTIRKERLCRRLADCSLFDN